MQSELLRLALGTFAWTFGPSLGVWLYVRFGVVAPFLWSAAWALILIALFWWLRLSGSTAIRPGKTGPPIRSPTSGASSRSRACGLRGSIAFGRSCYWTTFYVYAPILMVATGQGKLAGGIVVSLGNAVLIFGDLVGPARNAHRRAAGRRRCPSCSPR